MDPSPVGSGHSADRQEGTPSLTRRWAAAVSLLAVLALVCVAALMLVNNPLVLLGGLLGLALVVWGGWWMVTERNPRRGLGIIGIALGGLVVVGAVALTASRVDVVVLRALLLVALVGLATAGARIALVPDLHEVDRRRGVARHRPNKPVLLCNPWSGGGKVEKFGLVEMARDLGVETVLLDRGLDLAQLAHDAIERGADCLGMA
jgi:hypothetical protein